MSRSFFILAGGLGAVAVIAWFSRRADAQGQDRESETSDLPGVPPRLPPPETGSVIGDAIVGLGSGLLALGEHIGTRIGDVGLSIAETIFGPAPTPDIPGPLQPIEITLARRLSQPPYSMSSDRALTVANDIWYLIEGPDQMTIDEALLARGYTTGTLGGAGLGAITIWRPPAPSPAVSLILNP